MTGANLLLTKETVEKQVLKDLELVRPSTKKSSMADPFETIDLDSIVKNSYKGHPRWLR